MTDGSESNDFDYNQSSGDDDTDESTETPNGGILGMKDLSAELASFEENANQF